jgi:signal transduction histidine kinase
VNVQVSVGRDAIDVDVTDTGSGPASSSERTAGGTGNGLLGLRERVVLYDGDLDTGTTAHGGFRVHARLPLNRSG